MNNEKKIPVILDTDIGDDIDDTWALAMMLKSPELDVKLVVGDYGNPIYRAKILAKMLEVAGRTDVPVAIGPGTGSGKGNQSAWIADYDLEKYPGAVHGDGVGALIDTIMTSPVPVKLVCIGPVPNIQAALEREPKIAENAHFVGMHGSVRKGYGGSAEISAEWNVRANPAACRAAFTAPWEMTITPLDTCGLVHLRGEKYAKVRGCQDPLIQALVDNYRAWCQAHGNVDDDRAEHASSTLFDTVAVYLAFSEELLVMENLGIRVTDDGNTLIDDAAKVIRCAMDWENLPDFEDFLVDRLTGCNA